ncbi:hypothetical protein G6F70_004321 [Rhizopus microsporus]|nr:hypothetical protein G6F71_004331 [Rhizopus microsporus]KAG1200104.1 hypothetical protein G6F70_004321 [Rhizopus microsporus]KAG1211774.1 hypothetical protein G6F69_004287 [Rhizopus microsporus]KAG1233754.1 hypothetical protein G6F67_004035 [Rhizopus microsporus]KAG1265781.1 hypothetical protein G6F68_003312 [Rhizopus microsporus]
MAHQKPSTNPVENKPKKRQEGTSANGLPVPIHPDDAKDKVFTAILKALIKMGNKPSSPKELANIIVKHKYATLGGATPFATVSSRISQHFKRAAEHNPPRAPLLAKHVDQHHSRKINYSLATESVPNTGEPELEQEIDSKEEEKTQSDEEKNLRKKAKKSSPLTLRKSSRSRTRSQHEEMDSDQLQSTHISKKRKLDQSPSRRKSSTSTVSGFTKIASDEEEEEQEDDDSEHSDFHEEMLKGPPDDDLDSIPSIRVPSRRPSNAANPTSDISSTTSTTTHDEPSKPTLSIPPLEGGTARKPSFSFNSGFPGEQEFWTPFSFEHDFENDYIHDPSTAHHIPFNIATPESISVAELDDYFGSSSSSGGVPRSHRKSFSSAMLGPNDKSLLQKVLLASAARGVADKIEEESEESSARDQQKDEKDKEEEKTETGQKKVQAAAEENVETVAQSNTDNNDNDNDNNNNNNNNNNTSKVTTAAPSTSPPPSSTADASQTAVSTSSSKPTGSSSLMDVENSEDFVKFEDDEKKDPSPSNVPAAPTPILPAPTNTKRDILPASNNTNNSNTASSAAVLSASELLKSMNIQNINLSALQQMTSNLQALQQLSPTFDLAKTMAIYMQTLTKSAAAAAAANHASSSSSLPPSTTTTTTTSNASIASTPTTSTAQPTSSASPSIDIKSILSRFPALEAFLKKDNNITNKLNTGNSAPPPLVSPTTDTAPNLAHNATEPVVHTLTPMTPAMYITVIDHIAVCVVVLEKTETTPEYRIMRRLDTGFINGTALLAAGGIETESERSMILSFEMERVRMPKRKSQLFGTWIPLRRAQELAITCSIQHKLGHFLDDSIESYFPSPLPIQITRKPTARDNRLTALALAALRTDKAGPFAVPPISRQSSSGSVAATQLQELLLANPHKALKTSGPKTAPILGQFDTKKRDEINDAVSSQGTNQNNSDTSSHDGDNESDTDVKHSILTGSALQELFSRASLAPPTHIHPKDLQKKRRRSSLPEMQDDKRFDDDQDAPEPKLTTVQHKHAHARKRSGGKWSTAANGNNGGGKLASYGIKKSASTGGSMMRRTPAGGKRIHMQQKKVKEESEDEEDEVKNMVVEHKTSNASSNSSNSSSSQPVISIPKTSSESLKEDDDNDEDEDIDIGGSDFDDDLR